jgi:uncharacterized cupin superfamily protein
VTGTGIAHFDDAVAVERRLGHLNARWTFLGEAAGSVGVGVRRLEVAAGAWSTPVHDHGGAEEIFYVLAGRGLSWCDGATAEIGVGDCIVYIAGGGAHSLHALEPLDVLAFGPRHRDPSTRYPRLGLSMIGSRFAQSFPQAPDGAPLQFARELELGPPPLPAAPGPREHIVNVADVEPQTVERPRIARTRRNLGRAAGSVATGLQHVEVVPERMSAPAHCHSLEEEIFVILDGEGALMLDGAPTPVRAGNVVSRPPGTGVAHAFVAGPGGLRYLAYGTREQGDMCYYPDSGKIAFRGVGVIARVERVDYWDGED